MNTDAARGAQRGVAVRRIVNQALLHTSHLTSSHTHYIYLTFHTTPHLTPSHITPSHLTPHNLTIHTLTPHTSHLTSLPSQASYMTDMLCVFGVVAEQQSIGLSGPQTTTASQVRGRGQVRGQGQVRGRGQVRGVVPGQGVFAPSSCVQIKDLTNTSFPAHYT